MKSLYTRRGQRAARAPISHSELGVSTVAACLCALWILFIFRSTEVQGSSMEPTLHHGDHLAVVPLFFPGIRVTRDTIVMVDNPAPGEAHRLVKRVAGMPGDIIRWTGKEWRVVRPPASLRLGVSDPDHPIALLGDAVFIEGDNHQASLDSRTYGALPLTAVHGVVVARLYPHPTLFVSPGLFLWSCALAAGGALLVLAGAFLPEGIRWACRLRGRSKQALALGVYLLHFHTWLSAWAGAVTWVLVSQDTPPPLSWWLALGCIVLAHLPPGLFLAYTWRVAGRTK